MQFSKNGTTWYAWEPYTTQRTITLLPGDGLKTVYVRFRDSTNNISKIFSASITLDTSPPSGTISINNGAAATATTAVVLTLDANDSSSVACMQFSKNGTNWFPWEPYVATRPANFLPGPG